MLYVLDEPSIGLHQRDNRKLLATLGRLRDLGNTVVVVEHDEETIRAADYVVDLGPGAGELGGQLIFQGSPAELIGNGHGSLTGAYLGGQSAIETPKARRKEAKGEIVIKGARANNLKDVDVKIPLGRLVAVTGVSGSGKSTLVNDILYKSLAREFYRAADEPGAHDKIEGINLIDKVIEIDQSPIGRTPRSNPATYTSLFTFIRELFAMVPEARTRGFKPGRFSFNVKGGRCEACQGDGVIAIEMHFLPNVYVTCEQCKGRRYNRETLEIKYRGKSIADVLELTVDQALPLLENFPPIATKLRTLQSVGLGYITLGQSATTLSGGEAQRVKLSRELSKRGTGRTLYILDEPTTGLHFEDVRKLLDVLMRLVEQGNTIVVIEHNLDVIKSADWLIDLGPEGGGGGGRVVAQGTPEQVAKAKNSATGHFLNEILEVTPRRSTGVGQLPMNAPWRRMPVMNRRLAAGVVTLAFPVLATAQSPPLVVLSSNATRAALQQLAPEMERAAGRAVELRFANSADLRTRIEQGERFDVAVLTAPAIEASGRKRKAGARFPRRHRESRRRSGHPNGDHASRHLDSRRVEEGLHGGAIGGLRRPGRDRVHRPWHLRSIRDRGRNAGQDAVGVGGRGGRGSR